MQYNSIFLTIVVKIFKVFGVHLSGLDNLAFIFRDFTYLRIIVQHFIRLHLIQPFPGTESNHLNVISRPEVVILLIFSFHFGANLILKLDLDQLSFMQGDFQFLVDKFNFINCC